MKIKPFCKILKLLLEIISVADYLSGKRFK